MAHLLTRLDGTQVEIIDEAGVLNLDGRQALAFIRKYIKGLRAGDFRPATPRAAGRLRARYRLVAAEHARLRKIVSSCGLLDDVTAEVLSADAALVSFYRDGGDVLMAMFDAAEPGLRIREGLTMGWLHFAE
jgi:hypothetical protein